MKKDIKQTKKNNSQINIHEEYLQYHEKYIGKYGSKTVVLMQVGSFFECYSTILFYPMCRPKWHLL